MTVSVRVLAGQKNNCLFIFHEIRDELDRAK